MGRLVALSLAGLILSGSNFIPKHAHVTPSNKGKARKQRANNQEPVPKPGHIAPVPNTPQAERGKQNRKPCEKTIPK
jgi:hypothetical protein